MRAFSARAPALVDVDCTPLAEVRGMTGRVV
jgi:hypothetical protein